MFLTSQLAMMILTATFLPSGATGRVGGEGWMMDDGSWMIDDESSVIHHPSSTLSFLDILFSGGILSIQYEIKRIAILFLEVVAMWVDDG